MPPIAVAILLFLVLGLVGVRTTQKGLRQLQREGGFRRLCGGGEQAGEPPEGTGGGATAAVVAEAAAAAVEKPPSILIEEGGPTVGELKALDSVASSLSPFPLAPAEESALSFLLSDDEGDGPAGHPHHEQRRGRSRLNSLGSIEMGSGGALTPVTSAVVVVPIPAKGMEAAADGMMVEEVDEEEAARLCAALVERERRTALWKPALLTLCFAGVLTLESLAGKGQAGARCSPSWWVMTVAVIPWALSFTAFMRRYLLADAAQKERVDFPFVAGDPSWTPKNTILFPSVCVGAGIMAGIFGIGGGLIKGPLLLEIGVLPPIASMVTAVMVLYTAATSTVVYALFGMLSWDYAVFFFCWAVIWTAVGQTVLEYFLKKYRMASVVVLAIGITVLLSVIVYVSHAIREIVVNPQSALAAPNFCPAGR